MQAEKRISHQEFRRQEIAQAEAIRAESFNWIYKDSSLLEGKKPFHLTFSALMPEKRRFRRELNLKEYIEKTLRRKKGKAVGVEIGGTASELFAGFKRRFFKKSAGVNLTDYRDPLQVPQDESIHHTVITGNMLLEETHQKVEEWLGGDKIDFIMMRMIGGMSDLPNEPFYMSKQANFWYKHLAEGGMILSQVPDAFRGHPRVKNFMREWVDIVNKEYKGRLHVDYKEEVICLRKLRNAPEELPLLDARFVVTEQRKAEKEMERLRQEWAKRRSTTQS